MTMDANTHQPRLLTSLVDDSFAISYEAGFILFLSLAILVGLVTIGIRFEFLDTGRGCRRIDAGRMETLRLAISSVVTFLVARPICYAFQRKHEYIEQRVIRVFSFIFVTTSMFFIILCKCCNHSSLAWDQGFSRAAIIGMDASTFLVVPGLILLAMYCRHMQDLDHYHYFGPMYLGNFQVKVTEYIEENENYYFRSQTFRGIPQVAFGYDWAGCPNNEWCETWIEEVPACTFCERQGDYDDCREGTWDDADACVRTMYSLNYWEDVIGWPRTSLLKDQPPVLMSEAPVENVTQWPVASFYGDCESCQVLDPSVFAGEWEYARNLKIAGSVLASAGTVVIVGVIVFWWWQETKRNFLKNKKTNHESASTGIEGLETASSTREPPNDPQEDDGEDELILDENDPDGGQDEESV